MKYWIVEGKNKELLSMKFSSLENISGVFEERGGGRRVGIKTVHFVNTARSLLVRP